jgi:hypothetical protein
VFAALQAARFITAKHGAEILLADFFRGGTSIQTLPSGRNFCYHKNSSQLKEDIMPNVEKISVTLPAEMVAGIRAAVDGGEYSSASKVIREALQGEELPVLSALVSSRVRW